MADITNNVRSTEKSGQAMNADSNKLNDVKTNYSKAAKALNRRQKYDRIEILAPSGTKERWKALAKGAGQTMAEFIISKVNRNSR